MTISAYSTYASYLGNVRQFQSLQQSLAELSQQLALQKKSTDLSAYGTDSSRLLDLRSSIGQRQSYLQSISSLRTEVKAYDQVFTRLQTIASNAFASFTSPLTDVPVKEQQTIRLDGDIGDAGDSYRVTISGRTFGYLTNAQEGSLDEITGNLALQINQAGIGVTAEARGREIILTARQAGITTTVSGSVANIAGGSQNSLTVVPLRAAKNAAITQQVEGALSEISSLLNERINDRFLFGGNNGDNLAPALDLTNLTHLINPEVTAQSPITQQLASGTIQQRYRISTDYLGTGQSETFTINATNFTFTGPQTAQQLALAAGNAIAAAFPGVINVSDIDANGFTLTSAAPGTAFTASISGTDPTPSSLAVLQANVPIGATQTQQVNFSGDFGKIGQIFSISLTEPPANSIPALFTYETKGGESADTILNHLVSAINSHQPPYTLTASNGGNGRIDLSSSLSFTAHAAFGYAGNVQTEQRTIAPVAQEETIRFPGPFGDAGETYGVNFTVPVAASFTFTTNIYDTEATISEGLARAINANTSLGVTASVKGGQLVIRANQPGTAFSATVAPLTDSNPVVQSLPPVQTQTIANIAPGPLPQIDKIHIGGPVGLAGVTYTLTVNGQNISYTSTGGETDSDAIAINLAALVNAASPPLPVTALPGSTGSGDLRLTALAPGTVLQTSISVNPPLLADTGDPVLYNAYREGEGLSRSWTRAQGTIADHLTVEHGFTANETAIQRLVQALRYAKDAAQDPDHYTGLIETAKNLARDALSGLRALQSENSAHDALLDATTLSHQTVINLNTDASDKIETIDPAAVAAKLQSAQVQLQALFSVTASSGRISLINFLT